MYWWNIGALVKELKENTLSEAHKKSYYLAEAILLAIAGAIGSGGIASMIALIAILPITIWGIYSCFEINAGGDNKNFIERMVCLGWVCGLRVGVITLAIALLPLVIVAIATRGNPLVTAIISEVWAIAFVLAFYLYLRTKIKDVSHQK